MPTTSGQQSSDSTSAPGQPTSGQAMTSSSGGATVSSTGSVTSEEFKFIFKFSADSRLILAHFVPDIVFEHNFARIAFLQAALPFDNNTLFCTGKSQD